MRDLIKRGYDSVCITRKRRRVMSCGQPDNREHMVEVEPSALLKRK